MTDAEMLDELDTLARPDTQPTEADPELCRAAAARIRELLVLLANTDMSEALTVRHVRRGTRYAVLATGGTLQSSAGPLPEGTKITTYMGEDFRIWHRASSEFDDGRFVPE